MKQVMVPEVREHSIPIHAKNGPSFSFMTAKWLFPREKNIQITDSLTWKGSRKKSTQRSAWVMLTKENFGLTKPRIESKKLMKLKLKEIFPLEIN